MEEYLHNAGCDITTLIRDHFATLDYLAFLFEELWQQECESLTSHWELQDEIAELKLSSLSAAAARRVHTAGVGPRFSQPVSETLVRHIYIC